MAIVSPTIPASACQTLQSDHVSTISASVNKNRTGDSPRSFGQHGGRHSNTAGHNNSNWDNGGYSDRGAGKRLPKMDIIYRPINFGLFMLSCVDENMMTEPQRRLPRFSLSQKADSVL